MKIVKKATLKYPISTGLPEGATKKLALFQIEKGVHRWITDPAGEVFDPVDYLDIPTALKSLRVMVEGDPNYVGVDLTVYPVEPTADERAAARIVEDLADGVPLGASAATVSWVSEIIRQETAIDKLTDSISAMLAYYINRAKLPKPPGLDMTHAGLAMEVLIAMEKSQQQDYTTLKKRLVEDVSQVKIFTNMPPEKGNIQ